MKLQDVNRLAREPQVLASLTTAAVWEAGPIGSLLTVRVQQSGDPQLSLRDAKGLLQVVLVAPASGFGQIHQVRPESTQDGQEDHSTPPASFEIFHV